MDVMTGLHPRGWFPGCLLAALVLGMALSSCSPAGTQDASDPVRMRILMTDDWGDRPAFLAAVREFEDRNPGVRVQIDKLPIRNMADAVRAQVAAGDPVDLVQWHAFAAGAQGFAEPLDDLWEQAGLTESEYFPGAYGNVVWGDNIYGVPLDINALVLFYRADVLQDAGLDPPDGPFTFGDLEDYGRRLAAPDGSRRVIAIANSYWAAYGWVRANGGELVSVVDGRPRFTLDAPEVVEALDFLGRIVREELAFAPAGANSSADALALFRAGSSAFHASGSWDLAKLDQEALDVTYGASEMPRGTTGQTSGSVTGGSSFFVPRGAAHRELAFELMTTVTADHHALRLAQEEGRLPVRPRVYEDPFFQDPALQVVLGQLASAHPLLIEAFPQAANAWETAFSSVLRAGVDAGTALRAAQAEAESSLAGPEAP